jgi:hypothetical protein
MDASCNSGRVVDEQSQGLADPEALESTAVMALAPPSRIGGSEIVMNCIVIGDSEDPGGLTLIGVDNEVAVTPVASAGSGFGVALRKARGLPIDEIPDDLAMAAASNDLAAVGRLLGPQDVNAVCLNEKELPPESLVRRPFECSLLDVAVGSGSVELTKYLLEFHRARPTRETLKQSISTGNLELIKLMRERLPEDELRDRMDLMEVAAEFHQEEVSLWLLRDATLFDSELLAVFALERKLADSLVVALENGFRPWWGCTREVSLKCRASSQLDIAPAPEGLSSEGGWWTDISGAVSALQALGCGNEHASMLTSGERRVESTFKGEWTEAMSKAQLGKKRAVKSVVLPVGVTALGKHALGGFEVLESVAFPAGCTVMGYCALRNCVSIKAISLPACCAATGAFAHWGSRSLVSVVIPVGCTSIGDGCVYGGSALTS